MEIIEVRREEQNLIQECKNQTFPPNLFQSLKNSSLKDQHQQAYLSQKLNGSSNGFRQGEGEEEKRQCEYQNSSSDEDRSSEELKQVIKYKQDKYRVEIRNKKNKQALNSKRKALMKTFQNHLQNLQGVRQQSEANKEEKYKQANEEFRQQIFEKSVQALSQQYEQQNEDQLESVLEDIYILMRIDHKFAGSTNHISLCFYLIEILKNSQSSCYLLIKSIQIICSLQDYFQLELNEPALLVNVLTHQYFIQTLSSMITRTVCTPVNLLNNILYTLYVFTERDNKFVDVIINEQIIEKSLRNFDNKQSTPFSEEFDDTTWIYLLALYSNLAQHSKFPQHLNYFGRNIHIFINMLRLQIQDESSNQIFKYQILKSLSYLMRKETSFVSIFNGDNDYIDLIQIQVKQYSTNYLLLSEIIDIISCVSSMDDNENLIYKLVFDYSKVFQNFKQSDSQNSFFLLDAMISCLTEKIDINIDQKIYLTILNTLLSGSECLRKCKDYKLAHKLIKILSDEQNEKSYSTCLDVIRSFIILMDEEGDYKEIMEIANTTNLLQNYFNQTTNFSQETHVLQLCLLQHFLYAGDKQIKEQPNHTENPIKIILQKYHQLEFLDNFQYDQTPQIYQISSQIITQYIDSHLD